MKMDNDLRFAIKNEKFILTFFLIKYYKSIIKQMTYASKVNFADLPMKEKRGHFLWCRKIVSKGGAPSPIAYMLKGPFCCREGYK